MNYPLRTHRSDDARRSVAVRLLLIRGVVYFGLVFGVGFVLGTMRVLLLVPRLGERTAELLEAPLMLTAIYFAARFLTYRFSSARPVEHLYSGVLALVLLLTVEFSLVLGLQGMSLSEYFAGRDPIAGAVYVVMLIIFAVMPWLVGNRRTTV